MFQGSMVALVTPMSGDGRVDFTALDALLDWHLAEGTDGVVAVGTTGESATLEDEEHMEVVARCVRRVKGRIPVIAGTGSNNTAHAAHMSRRAQDLGANAVLTVVPYYNKPMQEGLYRHFRAIAEAVSLPVLLYNVPGRTITDLLPATVERLAKLPNIAGIKEATGDVARAEDIRRRCGDAFTMISGDDATAREFILQGGVGVISVTANVAPKLMHEMIAAARRGDTKKAAEIDARLAPLHKALFVESSPIPVKWALAEMGRIPPGIRLPLTPLADEHHPALRTVLKTVGAL
ncbi:MAG TPA: 4-hydroxy-tetrahydrodipicolinate synthase [Gammaproteobacteria bacterium]|jgi:4-hydroxy-tetrahydrodipicolinate synthase|nr:4-hydroxy-tetrahydrodipicolinate synthase [Gammaproteobacteria bacterium]